MEINSNNVFIIYLPRTIFFILFSHNGVSDPDIIEGYIIFDQLRMQIYIRFVAVCWTCIRGGTRWYSSRGKYQSHWKFLTETRVLDTGRPFSAALFVGNYISAFEFDITYFFFYVSCLFSSESYDQIHHFFGHLSIHRELKKLPQTFAV